LLKKKPFSLVAGVKSGLAGLELSPLYRENGVFKTAARLFLHTGGFAEIKTRPVLLVPGTPPR
jgi:hypothetical protein